MNCRYIVPILLVAATALLASCSISFNITNSPQIGDECIPARGKCWRQ
jgi:hypothetical protein